MTASTLAAFLLARLDEDEAAAREAGVVPGGDVAVASLPDGVHRFVTANGPARVLREVEAKRAIVEAHEALSKPVKVADRLMFPSLQGALEIALRRLASVYRDHPDFDEGWLP